MLNRMTNKITIEKLAEMSQKEFHAIRTGMHDGFSKIRGEMGEIKDDIRGIKSEMVEMRGGINKINGVLVHMLALVTSTDEAVRDILPYAE